MQIEINIPRPFRTIMTIGVVLAIFFWVKGDPRLSGDARAKLLQSQTSSITGEGGEVDPMRAVKITNQIQDMRALQALLARREELLRYQVDVLAQERESYGANVPPAVEEQFRQSVTELTDLIKDQKKGEAALSTWFQQLWEAEGRASQIADASDTTDLSSISLSWPVEPVLGVSAYFLDPDYKEHFGFEHYAIDIPVAQGSDVYAAEDGTIKDVVDNGLGFNYVTIQGKAVTLYGHLSAFNVVPGQTVYKGQLIGKSGGRPGTPGAGFATTGPHLHFSVSVKGSKVDPLQFLPARGNVDMKR